MAESSIAAPGEVQIKWRVLVSRLPNVKTGDSVVCTEGRLDEKQTSPPKRLRHVTLLAAMTGIARFVSDPEIKKVLRDTDGLGTEATRAVYHRTAVQTSVCNHKEGVIHSTEIGRQLVNSLPERMVVLDMTAHWESQLKRLARSGCAMELRCSP